MQYKSHIYCTRTAFCADHVGINIFLELQICSLFVVKNNTAYYADLMNAAWAMCCEVCRIGAHLREPVVHIGSSDKDDLQFPFEDEQVWGCDTAL